VTPDPEPVPGDVAGLREEWPDWTFGTVWASAADGPDARRIWAVKGGFLLSAWSAPEMSARIRREFGAPLCPAPGRVGQIRPVN
jgi:hypothetical protein